MSSIDNIIDLLHSSIFWKWMHLTINVKSGMIWENSIETYITIYKIGNSVSSMKETGHCDNLEGKGWVGGGVQDEGDTYIPMTDSYLCMAKTIIIL